MNQDLEHLRLLAIFHYVVAGLGALVACFPLIYLVLGLVMIFAPATFEGRHHHDEMIWIPGLFLSAFGSALALAGWAFATCVFLAGRNLARQRRYTFCLVMGAIMCIFVPFGTVLGVFTLIVLLRPSVRPLFEGQAG
jgi:ABC-type Fe3+ transport system permease subunit